MEENAIGKRKIKFYYHQWFCLGLTPGKFSRWCLPPAPSGLNLLGNHMRNLF